MILRRLSEAITEQNWFIVVIEVLVIVVGIFIGLQVDDWNDTRKDRKDEQLFLKRLHGDILLGEELSLRVRARRLERLELLMDAADILLGRAERDTLNQEECIATASSNYYNINVTDLSSLTQLAGTGRMDIIQDAELRSALVKFEQVKDALKRIINLQTVASLNLSSAYPDIIQLAAYFDPELGEARTGVRCESKKMRANQAFLNDFSVNVDRYDAYIRDGLAPWSSQFDRVHQLVDDALGISHGAADIQ